MGLEGQAEGLRQIQFFRDLEDGDLERIGRRCRWNQFEKDRQVIGQSDPTTDVFFILDGSVRAKSYSGTGREVSFTDIAAGDLFGEFSAIDGQPRASSVITLAACRIARMSRDDFRQTLLDFPVVALHLIEHLVAKSRSLSDRVFEFSTLPVHNRVQAELLRLAGDGPDADKVADDATVVIDPAPTHYEIATRISTHREAVTRELNHLVSLGLIRQKRGRIEILDLARLRALVED